VTEDHPILCDDGWQALTADPLPWLLDDHRPNLQWRVLVELLNRPTDSPAVIRARGGANAAEPVSSLIAELLPDGSWNSRYDWWTPYGGVGWRIVAATQCGADPSDPRLHSAVERLFAEAPGEGGFAMNNGARPSSCLTARILEATARLGWCRHARFQEGLAWLDEAALRSDDLGWRCGYRSRSTAKRGCTVTAVALLAALNACPELDRKSLRQAAGRSLVGSLDSLGQDEHTSVPRLGHPNLQRTDQAEILATLARSGWELETPMVEALRRLQNAQGDRGDWTTTEFGPAALPLPVQVRELPGSRSPWVTLRAVVSVLRYGVEAGLPRRFPERPPKPDATV